MKNLNLNYKYLFGKRGLSFILAASLAATLSGCGEKANCDITSSHVHKYVSAEGLNKYVDKEYLNYGGYERTDEYLVLDKDELDLRQFEEKHGLLRIDENIDTLLATQDTNVDYIEYRYEYSYLRPMPYSVYNGKVFLTYFTYIPTIGHSWTTDDTISGLTGEKRICHYKYQAFKIEIDEKGKRVIIPSDYVDNLNDIIDEFPYVKREFFKVFDKELDCEADYEDGPEEELTEEERREREANIDPSYNESSNSINRR